MKRFILAVGCILVLSASANAQTGRHRVYAPYYNGSGGISPGLSVYSNGTYSVDYFGGSKHYNFGYVPPARYPRHRRYNAGNGLIMNNTSIFYYEGMYLSPYNINSPVWGGW